jgi:hypothetical protein
LMASPLWFWCKQDQKTVKQAIWYKLTFLRADIDPITASRTGQDSSICGDCIHKGQPSDKAQGQAIGRTCYVTLAHGPLGKWKAYKRGSYSPISGHKEIAALGFGRMVRLGTYGDPCAVPNYIWQSLISRAQGHTAYTHGASNPMPQDIMTSADSLPMAQNAWDRGKEHSESSVLWPI